MSKDKQIGQALLHEKVAELDSALRQAGAISDEANRHEEEDMIILTGMGD